MGLVLKDIWKATFCLKTSFLVVLADFSRAVGEISHFSQDLQVYGILIGWYSDHMA